MNISVNRFSNLMALVVPTVGLFTSNHVGAASDFFLKLEGIEGESVSVGFEKQSDILSWSWGASNPAVIAGGTGNGKANFQDFSFSKRLSSASPPMMLACAAGKHFPKATLSLTRAGTDGGTRTYYVVNLTDVVITNYSCSRPEPTSLTADTTPIETIRFIFKKIDLEYRAAPVNGQAGVNTIASIEVNP